jgi:hypothetical protein
MEGTISAQMFAHVLLRLKLVKMNQISSFKNAACDTIHDHSIYSSGKRVVVKQTVSKAITMRNTLLGVACSDVTRLMVPAAETLGRF